MGFFNTILGKKVFSFIIIVFIIYGMYQLWQWVMRRDMMYRIAFGIGLMGLLLLGRVSGAVGIIGSENNAVNLMYRAVPTVGIIGSFLSHFKPRGMSYTLFTMAFIQFLIPLFALIISPEVNWGNKGVIGVCIANAVFSIIFIISALFFQRAQYTPR